MTRFKIGMFFDSHAVYFRQTLFTTALFPKAKRRLQ